MARKFAVLAVACLCSTLAMAQIQGVCGQASAQNKVGCTLANLYNGPSPTFQPGNLPIYQAGGVAADNGFDFRSDPHALTTTVGSELTTLPLTSPGSGFVFQLDKATGIPVRATQSLGPILTERGETVGRHKLFVAFAYQYFKFGSEDGIRTNGFQNVLQHAVDNPSKGEDSDLVTTNDAIDLKIHQFTAFATFGLTDKIDVSAVIPILNVRFGAYSNAMIHNFFAPNNPNEQHSFCLSTTPCLTKSFSNFRQATGIGDVLFRGKARIFSGEHTKLAIGADLRLPTGDELNFLGSGTYGVRPFAALSFNKRRFAPHANFGFVINGNSILAGDLTTSTKGHLPNELTYSVGTDIGVTSRFTLAADWLGEHFINGYRVQASTCANENVANPNGPPVYTNCVLGATSSPAGTLYPGVFNQTRTLQSSYSVNDISVGAKVSPTKNLLITFNAIMKLDDPGLRAKVVPLVSIGYAF